LIASDLWVVRLTSLKIGNTTVPLQAGEAIIDTGTSNTIIPQQDFASLFEVWSSQMLCDGEDKFEMNYFGCVCNDQEYEMFFPPLDVTLSAVNTYQIPPYEYIIRFDNICYIQLQTMEESQYWILGDAFLRNYVVIFD
jgi:hypothetical protein